MANNRPMTEDEKKLFSRLNHNEKHHSIRVCKEALDICKNKKTSLDTNRIAKAALLHDVGKGPTTKKNKQGRWISYNHDVEGVKLAEKILDYYNYENDEIVELIKDLPNLGENKYTKLLVKDEKLYITIGTNTNSGILDKDSTECDVPSFEWILTGKNYGANNTGAFVGYGIQNKSGEKIKEGIISNGSIISYDLSSGKVSTFATGIRNVEGIDFNNNGNIVAIVGGMEDEGSRAVKDDKDYIYEIKENAWYGWPDFSGGDQITSPRFSDGTNKLSYIIENHPTEVPLPPRYQHDKLKALNGLAIDSEGKCFPKDTVIFADNKDHYIYVLTEIGTSKQIVSLNENSFIEKIRYNDSSIYFLDNKDGCIYKIQGQIKDGRFNLPNVIWIFIVIFIMTIIMTIIYKIYNKK